MTRVHGTYRRHGSPPGAIRTRTGRRPEALWREFRRFIDAALRPDFVNISLLAAGFIALTTIVALTLVLHSGRVYAWEFDVMREVQSVESPEWVSTVTAGSLTDPFSLLGASIVLMVACGFLLFGRPVETVLVLLLMPLRFPAHFSKAIVERERPSGEVGLAGTGGDLSFASGHAEWLVTFYGFLVILALLRIKNSWLRAGIVTAFAVFAILSTFSRVNGGYHWPLDIVGGWIIGVGLLCLLFWLRRAALATTRAPRTQDSSADRSATNVS